MSVSDTVSELQWLLSPSIEEDIFDKEYHITSPFYELHHIKGLPLAS